MTGLTRFAGNGLLKRKNANTLIDRIFSDVWSEFDNMFNQDGPLTSIGKFSYPRMNIQNLDKEFLIEAAVPGLTSEQVKVEYANGQLVISAASQNEANKEQNGYIVRELHKSSFTRVVAVDEEVCDPENIDAKVENGVLCIKIPKKEVDKPEPKRIIEVK